MRPRTSLVAVLSLLASLSLAACGESDETAAAGAGGSAPAAGRTCQDGESLLTCGLHMNIAHRGGGLLRPEETLSAFENALAVGADVLELDVHATSDGVIVCMHDGDVDRTTDGSGNIADMTFDELRQLDAGYDFTTDDGATFPYRGQGILVPTLEEVLTAFPGVPTSIELKDYGPAMVDAVLEIVDAADMAENVVLASFDDDTVTDIRTKRPEILTSYGTGEMVTLSMLTPEAEATYEPPARIVQAPNSLVDRPFMELAARLDLRVQAWTVNEPGEMERLLRIDVDGVMTDDPAALAAVIAELGL